MGGPGLGVPLHSGSKPVVTEEDIKEAERIVYAQMKAYRASAACMAIRS